MLSVMPEDLRTERRAAI